jgi:hypothetical protein
MIHGRNMKLTVFVLLIKTHIEPNSHKKIHLFSKYIFYGATTQLGLGNLVFRFLDHTHTHTHLYTHTPSQTHTQTHAAGLP